MSSRTLAQISMRNPEFVDPDCLAEGSVPWLLSRYGDELLPPWLFRGWRGESGLGRPAWPALVLAKMLILRWVEEGMSRLASVGTAQRNTTWRAALCLEMGEPTPSEKTLRDFERFLRQRHPDSDTPRYLVLHEHIVRTCVDLGVVGERAMWSMDSTPMWCFGAVQDTVRLLGDGLRSLGKVWARATRTSLEEVAHAWGLDLLVAKSTKAVLRIDWRDREQRSGATDRLARWVIDVVRRIRRELSMARRGLRKALLRRCRNLLKVVHDDLRQDEQGRLVVARCVARGRLVSILDPDARHGRKSRAKTFKGFKLHVFGDITSGLIAGAAVTRGNVHDGRPAPRLLGRAQALGLEIEQLLADTAYGGARLRYVCQQQSGATLLAPPPPRALSEGKLGAKHFQVDLEAMRATCPIGVTTDQWAWVKATGFDLKVPRFQWPQQVCKACEHRAACWGKNRGGRRLPLHPYEREKRAARRDWARPEIRQRYRARSQCERLVHQTIRHGARQARAFGLGAANLQVHLVVTRCNLGLLAKKLAKQPTALLSKAS